jgi:hypothetical protein
MVVTFPTIPERSGSNPSTAPTYSKGASVEVTESKKRGDLFEEVICQLDSAPGEVRETGPRAWRNS